MSIRQVFFSALLLFTLTAQAQWSADPAAPLVICDAANGPTGLQVIADADSGWYVFWCDSRANVSKREVYGQHVDTDGNTLWPANGKLILSLPDSSINENRPVLMPDGSVLIAYNCALSTTAIDRQVQAMLVDADGMPLWSMPTTVVTAGAETNNYHDIKAVASDSGAWIAWKHSLQNSYDRFAYDHVNMEGHSAFGSPGIDVPNSNTEVYAYNMRSDLDGGLIFDWEGGSLSGTTVRATRMDTAGEALWPTTLNVSTGTIGPVYYDQSVGDSLGNSYCAFLSGQDIGMGSYDTSGTLTWGPQPLYACNESHNQNYPTVVIQGGHLFAGWSDPRPPAAALDMYVQKFNLDGTPAWTVDGVAAIQLPSPDYNIRPQLVAGDEGAVIATLDCNTGFYARRMHSDGTLDWSGPVAFCTHAFNPSLDDRSVNADGLGGIAAFWKGQQTGALYAAHIDKFGNIGDHTGIAELDGDADFTIRPNPATDRITIHADGPIGEVRILSMDERVVFRSSLSVADHTLDLSALAAGSYIVQRTSRNHTSAQRFIKQ